MREEEAISALKRMYPRWQEPGIGRSFNQCSDAASRLVERLPEATWVWVQETPERSALHVLVQLASGSLVDLTKAQFTHRELPERYAGLEALHEYWWRYKPGENHSDHGVAWVERS